MVEAGWCSNLRGIIGCFVLILIFCNFLKLVMCQLMRGWQKNPCFLQPSYSSSSQKKKKSKGFYAIITIICQIYNNKGEKEQMRIIIRHFFDNPASAIHTLTYMILAGEPGRAANKYA